MLRAAEGSTARLIQLCVGYFGFYVVTGVTVKYFRGAGLGEMEFLAYSTLGGALLCLVVAVAFGWWRHMLTSCACGAITGKRACH